MKSKRCTRCGRHVLPVDLAPTGTELVEPIPDTDGTVCARPFEGGLIGWVISAERPPAPMYRIYMIHDRMCPLSPRDPKRPPAEPEPMLFDNVEV